jgi:hypothetical protein
VIGVLGRQPIRRRGRGAQALAFAPLGRHPQAFLAPEPLDGLTVDHPALVQQLGMGTAVAPAGMGTAERTKLLAQRPITLRLGGLVALGGAVLTDDPAGQPLGETQHALQMVHGAAATCRAQKFPLASSRRASFSSSASASNRLSRAFSLVSSLRRLASSAFRPPYWARQRW